jgi:sialidase-1
MGAPALTHTDVFVSGQHGYHSYRIPAIEALPDGTLIAFAEARKHNLSDPGSANQDIDLVYKRSADGGATWSPMRTLEDAGDYWSAANAATLVDRTNGRLWVFYVRCRPGRNTSTARPGTDDIRNLARWSDDQGRTWSAPLDLTAVSREQTNTTWRASIPGPGGAIQTRTGRLLVPMWKAPFEDFAIFSDDHGQTWRRSALVPDPAGGNENQLVELSDGRILMDIRQNKGPRRWFSLSSDGGQTWSPHHPGLAVTRVMCAIERVPTKTGSCLIWTGPKGPDRRRLILRVSRDDGKTFSPGKPITDQFAAYSDLTVLPDGSVGIFWERGVERGYQFLTFTRCPPAFWESPTP